MTISLFPAAQARMRKLSTPLVEVAEQTSSSEFMLSEMLRKIFGWEEDVRSLIRTEWHLHRQHSIERAILQCWLNEDLVDHSDRNSPARRSLDVDWIVLALRTSAGNGDQTMRMGFAWRLEKEGDVHSAAALYVGMDQVERAVDMYTSDGHWVEAIILAALKWPNEWQRIANLVRRWTSSMLAKCDELRSLAARCIASSEVKPKQHWAPLSAKYAAFLPKRERRSQSEDEYARLDQITVELQSIDGRLASVDDARTASLSSRTSSPGYTGVQIKPQLKVVTDFGASEPFFIPHDDVFTDAAKNQHVSHARGASQSALSIRSDTPAVAPREYPGDISLKRIDSHHRPPPKFKVEHLQNHRERLATPVAAARDDPFRIRTRSDSKPGRGQSGDHIATPSRSNSGAGRYKLANNATSDADGMVPKALHVRSPPVLLVGNTTSDLELVMPDITESTVTIQTIEDSSSESEEGVLNPQSYDVSDSTADAFYSLSSTLSSSVASDIISTDTPGRMKSSLMPAKSPFRPPIRRAESCRPDIDHHRQTASRRQHSRTRGDGVMMQRKVSFQDLH
jgi:hypothetical protein